MSNMIFSKFFFEHLLQIIIRKKEVSFIITFGSINVNFQKMFYECKLCHKTTNIKLSWYIDQVICCECSKKFELSNDEKLRKILNPINSPSGFSCPITKGEDNNGNSYWFRRGFVD